MNRKQMKKEARKLLKGNAGYFVPIILLAMAASGLCAALQAITASGDNVNTNGGLLLFLIAGPVIISFAFIMLAFVDKKQNPAVKDILIGFHGKNAFEAILAFVRYLAFTLLWSLLFVIPGIIKGLSYSQMFFLMADKGLSAKDAQAKSMEIMEGHKWAYFVLQLSFIPWILLCLVTFGIATIYVVTYIYTAQAMFYRNIAPAKKSSK